MTTQATFRTWLAAAGLALAAMSAHASLPGPTPAQQQAAADKKAKDAADAAKAKEELTASMDAVTAHWRARAATQGWKSRPPVAIAAAAPAGAAAGASPGPAANAAAGVSSSTTGSAPTGQPAGQLTQASADMPIRSEKSGTAPPSRDVKTRPTPSVPAGTPPAVVKNTPKVKNK